ncbi:MAG: hypothetical protein KDC18_01000 [Alphaproteobacteria bacterium]|nr:hypothetical protein [Alphaproteobacteria bacterium]MCB9930574.1 hypothetical protein [Alphaproteobacteria bacterium]
MCTSIVEIAQAEGMAKNGTAWFPLTHAVVAFDHARYAMLEDAILIDFVNHTRGPGARGAVELTLESARALHAVLGRVIDAAEREEYGRPAADAPDIAADTPIRVLADAD